MEEVWKDINLASLNEQNSRRRPITTHSSNFIFQDFLARPFNIDPPKSTMLVSSSSSESVNTISSVSLYCPVSSPSPPTPPPPPPPLVTALSLSSRPHNNGLQPNQNTTVPKVISCFGMGNPTPFQSLGCTSSLPCFGSDNRFGQATDNNNNNNPGDRRNKRMIKNRESAARSRARKQAYTNELEQKVQLLAEENARLKRQQQELWETAAGHQQKKKSSLYRTSTAPF